MNLSLLFSSGVFDLFPQPVLCLREETLAACNAAARALGLHAGAEAGTFLGEDTAALAALTAPASLTLTLAGQARTVTALPDAEGLLLAADAPGQETLPPDALRAVSLALQSPLTDLLGACSALLPALEELESPALQRSAAVYQRAVYQLLRLQGHLRDYTAALTDALPLAREKTELCGFVHAIFEKTESLCASRGVTLHCKLPPRQMFAWIDTKRLEQAVLELLSNALKYTEAGGAVCMTLSRREQTALLTLTGGTAMDAAALSAAFSQFSAVSPLNDGRRGAGLGLPLARSIVQLHGGRLLLEQQADGTAVCLSLPLNAPDLPPRLKSPMRVPETSDPRRPVLIALSDVLPPEVFDSRNL